MGSVRVEDPEAAWAFACQVGLSEPEAVGWALTGYLHGPPGPRRRLDDGAYLACARAHYSARKASQIGKWTRLFGPAAYLWPLAGFTLDEATEMWEAGNAPTEGQLRVMAALAGPALPAGV
ncbi:MAG: hypothetical protein ACOH1Y_16905 [Propionicimonas sp.]